MKLILAQATITLLEEEYLEYHDGRDTFPFNLDCSICGITTLDRAEKLRILFITYYPYPQFKMESLQILHIGEVIELLFSISDFTPIIKC